MSIKERRGFFRIEDKVTLQVRKLDESKNGERSGLHFSQKSHYSLANELERMKAESRVYFRNIEKEVPDVARYFSHLEEKIDLIARTFILDSEDLSLQETQLVNISGSGISFTSEQAYDIDDDVEITFVLHPVFMMINANARVVTCDELDDGRYRLAIEFRNLSEDDRDLLIRHVVKKQMTDIRDNKP